MMRLRSTVYARLSLAVALLLGLRTAGCADSSAPESVVPDPDDGGSTIVPVAPVADAALEGDGSATDASDASVIPPNGCSADGWCRVVIPNDKVSLYGIWGSSAQDVWGVGSNGTVLHWNGSTWDEQQLLTDAGQPKALYGIWGSGPHDVWAFTANEIRHSDGWNGADTAWTTIEVTTKNEYLTASLRAVWGSGPTDVWTLVGSTGLTTFGTIQRGLHSAGWDGGTPSLVPAMDAYRAHAAGTNFLSVWGSGVNDVWIVGEAGRILHSDGYWGGLAEWTPTNSNTRSHLKAVWGSAADDVWAVGEDGTIRHFTYDEGGQRVWAISGSGVTSTLRSVWGSSATDVWVVGEGSSILHGDGTTWSTSQAPPLPSGTPFHGVWGSGPNDVWIVGERVVLHRSGAAGGTK